MALAPQITTREYDKFVEVDGGLTAVRVTGTNFSGTVTLSGLSIGGLLTEVEINPTTWMALPAVAQTDRNTLTIQNDTGENIFLNFVASDVSGTRKGKKIPDQGEVNYSLTEDVVIYAKSESLTVKILIEELA